MSPTFAQLGVPQFICRALERRGITDAFEIQAATVADALDGRDVCGRAPTGSGKTIAFGIPLVANGHQAQSGRPRSLVLAPTRELAEQITTEIRSFAGSMRVAAVYGGVGYGPQVKALRQGADILVACPGRLEDLIEQGIADLSDVDQVVLDEADRMADMGFMPAVRRLLDRTARDRQTMLYSATLDGDVAKLTRDYQRDPVRHEVGDATPDITAAHHRFWKVNRADRVDAAGQAVNAVWPAIVFCRTRHGSDRLARQLSRADIKAVAIHGGRSQGQRTRALRDFAEGRVHALVATDVAARGIHVDDVALVVHFDPPEDHKAYVHRSGRTARAGQGGVVLSLVQPDQVKDLRKMQRKIDLDEPFTDADAVGLRDLSSAPERTLAPDTAERQNRSNGNRSSSGRGKKHNGPKGKHRHKGKGGAQKARSRHKAKGTSGSSQGGRSTSKQGKKGPSSSNGNRSGNQRRSGAGTRGGSGGQSQSGRSGQKRR